MTPQSNFAIVAPVREGHKAQLQALLIELNTPGAIGMADPENEKLPLGQFETIHFARFVVIDDRTLVDFLALRDGIPRHEIALAFLGDCDGPAEETMKALVSHGRASETLAEIFNHCQGFQKGDDLLEWMKSREHSPAANYVNWVGRTVKQVREEAKLRERLGEELHRFVSSTPDQSHNAAATYQHLRRFYDRTSELHPSPEARTPLGWQVSNLLDFAILPFLLVLPWLLALPYLLVLPPYFSWVALALLAGGMITFVYFWRKSNFAFAILATLGLGLLVFPFVFLFVSWIPLAVAALVVVCFLLVLRCYEKNEPEIIPREPASRMDRHVEQLAEREDYDVTNQFTVVGSVKPSTFRRLLASSLLWFINYGARHLYTRGHLGRIQTIHFARWVFIDNKARLIFASNYDGSLEAYMDDFINKVGWGLNLAFGSGLGYPRVNWLVANGSKEEQKFKYTLRRHQLPTEVWYKAYPGLTAYDLARNSRVHRAIRQPNLSDHEIHNLLRDL